MLKPSANKFLTASPTEGNRWDLNVGGNDVKEPSIGLQRSRVFGPASEDTQQTKPPEEEAGENPGGRRLGNETLCHESSYETLSLLSLFLSLRFTSLLITVPDFGS